jgi:hypothetical protein
VQDGNVYDGAVTADDVILRARRALGLFPLPGGERGFDPIERAYPLTPSLSPWEREPSEFIAPAEF